MTGLAACVLVHKRLGETAAYVPITLACSGFAAGWAHVHTVAYSPPHNLLQRLQGVSTNMERRLRC